MESYKFLSKAGSVLVEKVKVHSAFVVDKEKTPELYDQTLNGDYKLPQGVLVVLQDGTDRQVALGDGELTFPEAISLGGSGGDEDPITIGDVEGLQAALNGKAASSHTHTIAQVSGLQDELDSKAASVDIPDVSGFATADALTSGLAGKANTSHTHTIAQVTGLQGELDSKAGTGDIPDVSGFATSSELTSGLAGKANTSHTHTIAQVTGLQDALDSKLSATQGEAVTDATDETDVVTQLNALLASLRTGGIIA